MFRRVGPPLALWLLFALAALPRTATAQPTPTSGLDAFIQGVARAWAAEDVAGLVARAAPDAPIRLDAGDGPEASSGRHVAAALRRLFADRETLSARPVQVTLAGSDPVTGFAHLAWTYRDRGAPAPSTHSVYVGAAWRDGAWRISELRLIP